MFASSVCCVNYLFTVRRQFYNVIANEKTLLLKFSNAREPPTTDDEETKNAMFFFILICVVIYLCVLSVEH